MRKYGALALVLAMLIAGAAFSCTPPQESSGTWNMVFEDNFDQGPLNTTYWNTGWHGTGITGPVQEQETSCYDPAQVQFAYSALVLAVRDPGHTTHCPKYPGDSNPDRPYLSGAIESSGKVDMTPTSGNGGVLVEFRAQVTCVGGQIANWPALWADGYGQWPSTGELDVMEGLSGSGEATWHGPDNGGAGHNFGGYGQPCSGFHTYAAEWRSTDHTVVSYLDGSQKGSYTSSTNITTAPMYLILGEQTSPQNSYGGPVQVPSTLVVDWVRVYTR